MIAKNCIRCNKVVQINITREQLMACVSSDKLIQNALPQLTPGEREMFISGLCETCWEQIFPKEEDVEEPFDGRDDEV